MSEKMTLNWKRVQFPQEFSGKSGIVGLFFKRGTFEGLPFSLGRVGPDSAAMGGLGAHLASLKRSFSMGLGVYLKQEFFEAPSTSTQDFVEKWMRLHELFSEHPSKIESQIYVPKLIKQDSFNHSEGRVFYDDFLEPYFAEISCEDTARLRKTLDSVLHVLRMGVAKKLQEIHPRMSLDVPGARDRLLGLNPFYFRMMGRELEVENRGEGEIWLSQNLASLKSTPAMREIYSCELEGESWVATDMSIDNIERALFSGVEKSQILEQIHYAKATAVDDLWVKPSSCGATEPQFLTSYVVLRGRGASQRELLLGAYSDSPTEYVGATGFENLCAEYAQSVVPA